MELRSLRFFLAAAAEKSITRAAARTYISQSALTRQIQSLEEECGAPLFVRTRTGLQLTEAASCCRSGLENCSPLLTRRCTTLRVKARNCQATSP